MWRRPGLLGDLARRGDVERPDAPGLRLGHVERLAVGRQAAAVRRGEREGDFLDLAAVCLGVVDAAAIPIALAHLAEVGEVEAAVRIEDKVVGPVQLMVRSPRIERRDGAAVQVDSLDASARVVGGLHVRAQTGSFSIHWKPPLLQM